VQSVHLHCKPTLFNAFHRPRRPIFSHHSAKHLRAKDRALNNHVYPKIHYPELYILEGGYCEYFKQSSARCHPPAYVSMDDPNHTASRRADLDQFRKARFGRTKSYTYGDHGTKLSTFTLGEASKRNTAPGGGSNYLLAAADAARTRRGGLGTLHEDGNTTQEEDDMDFNPSPCPAASKQGSNGRKPHRPLARAETYGPTKLFF
jgi:M-phase inducer tyrosine phosphatase